MRINREYLAWILGAALFYFAIITLAPSDFAHSGGNFHLAVSYAESLSAEKALAEPVHVAPGQPAVLALVSSALPLSTATVRFVQLILLVLLVSGTYFLASELFGRQVARVASIIVAFWPPVVLQLFSQSADLLFSVLVVCSLYFLIKAEKLGRWDDAVIAGVAAGFAAMTDPIGLYLPLLFILPLFVRRFTGLTFNKRLMIGVVFILTFILSLMPWYYRNVAVFGINRAPVVQKSWEIEFLKNQTIREYIVGYLDRKHLPAIREGAQQFFLIPYGIDSLHQDTELSYKDLLVRSLRGENTRLLSFEEKVILLSKMIITALHWALLLLLAAGLWLVRRNQISFLYVSVVLYFIVATFSYGIPEFFRNISPLNGFFFHILPLSSILAAVSLVALKKNFSQRSI